MKTPQQISSELKQFTGSTTVYKHWLDLKYTDGIKYLADETNKLLLAHRCNFRIRSVNRGRNKKSECKLLHTAL
jgi:hypothetical protein